MRGDVFFDIDLDPFSFLDFLADRFRGFSLLVFLENEDDFFLADWAHCSVVARVAIEQALVSLVFVARAEAGFLVEDLTNAGCQRIGKEGGLTVTKELGV
jgi:hypothetical protein